MGKYDDIINLPHHTSSKHPRMSIQDRAAQFSSFQALSGHGAAINETARLTAERIELDENEIELLNGELQHIQAIIDEQPEITVTYFVPDKNKSGGAYVDYTGVVKKIDDVFHNIVMSDGTLIDIEQIIGINIGQNIQ